ncbi:MAG: fasciclin domain-containing protein [Proteobacteria bacterium]|nr:fasciclin domain-containing protein [Pseudomonadota bacterium]NBQ63888.1 fasciclin domain-containing protein [Pseudomonadota bacterium]NDB73596.1 fasciclin domain-containing protein [Pseudomonadota bacterium]NDF38293.1 fasciclin domain-containing protein [Pseudomonadota bacterium]NDF95580.1 fasciclin domain-containing protein [Pseudomonadota bacterium]
MTPTAYGTKPNIVQTAMQAGSFNTLLGAVKEAGLVEALSGEGALTVFAPTDEAFAKLGEETIRTVLADKALLTKILTYHVVSGRVMAGDVVKLQTAPTLQGQDVRISTIGGVRINDSMVVTPDIEASNGIIHIIDTVLIPA